MPTLTNAEYRESLWKLAEELGDIIIQAIRQRGDDVFDGERLHRKLHDVIYTSGERDIIKEFIKADKNAPADKNSYAYLCHFEEAVDKMRNIILTRKVMVGGESRQAQVDQDEHCPNGNIITDKFIDREDGVIYLIKPGANGPTYSPLSLTGQPYKIFLKFLRTDNHILTKNSINLAADPDGDELSPQIKSRIRRFREELEKNGLPRGTIESFATGSEVKYRLIL